MRCHCYILVGIIYWEFELMYTDMSLNLCIKTSNVFNLNKHFFFFFLYLKVWTNALLAVSPDHFMVFQFWRFFKRWSDNQKYQFFIIVFILNSWPSCCLLQFPKILQKSREWFLSYALMYVNNCGIKKKWGIPHRGGGAQTRSLTVQKNEKITRTVPILKSNFQ